MVVLPLLGIASCADRPLVYGEGGSDGTGGQSGDVCALDEDCSDGATCFEGVCVQTGVLRVSLAWTARTDLDLHVLTPSGAHVYFGDPELAGLELDVDDCVGGDCRTPGGTHVENIFFRDEAERGLYKLWVVNFDGRQGGEFSVEVVGDVSAQWSGDLQAAEGSASPVYEFTWD